MNLDTVSDSDHLQECNSIAGLLWRARKNTDASSRATASSHESLDSYDGSSGGKKMESSGTADSAHCSKPFSIGSDSYTTRIWCYWHEGTVPDLVLRCINSIRVLNPSRRLYVLNKETVHDFLSPSDWPLGCTKHHVLAGSNAICFESPPEGAFFENVQKLSNWIRLKILHKFGGVWMDASCFCTAPLETWVTDMSKVTLFSVRMNTDVYENWAIASPSANHPTIKLWLDELAAAHASTTPGTCPLQYIDAALHIPAVRERWKPDTAQAPSLPYSWCHLALLVALHKHEEAYATLCILDSCNGPMHRRSKYAPLVDFELGNAIASDLASLSMGGHDRYFIKFVGHDLEAIQMQLAARNFSQGSALHCIFSMNPRPIWFGQPLSCSASHFQFKDLLPATFSLNISGTSTDNTSTQSPRKRKAAIY
eukprot:CAMPEP_0174757494 /NCGR_PEP_ID=MMETSP1094-20130205/107289_1 /TAXON_ID=156173 /ORGANISM="Chrysochromulina brevifilum, Strain UTEX LB 985" /LENGTH=423 /DNA_ID=CAMNT_0015963409 /DNA_START=446 /DNA_END=1717 /DNA_ORIENTATION=-